MGWVEWVSLNQNTFFSCTEKLETDSISASWVICILLGQSVAFGLRQNSPKCSSGAKLLFYLCVLPRQSLTAWFSKSLSALLSRICLHAAPWHFSQCACQIMGWIFLLPFLRKVKGRAWPLSSGKQTLGRVICPGWSQQKQEFSGLSMETFADKHTFLTFPKLFWLSCFASTLSYFTWGLLPWQHGCLC